MPKAKKAKKIKVKKEKVLSPVRDGISPQLCKTYNPDKFKWDKLWIMEPKFDGLRCIVVVESLPDGGKLASAYSRNGKPLWNMDAILGEISNTGLVDVVIDGEVYTKDWNLSMSIVKRSTKSHPDQDKLRYNVWDCLTLEEWKAGESSVSNHVRKERLLALDQGVYVELVRSSMVGNAVELQYCYSDFLSNGYEGAILKDPDGIYELGRRSPSWLKIKPWHDADLTCTGAFPGEGKHAGRIGGLILEGKAEWNGQLYDVHTEVGTGFTDKEREDFQRMSDAGKLLGVVIEIKFQDITVDGSCRFPVYHRLRDDKGKG